MIKKKCVCIMKMIDLFFNCNISSQKHKQFILNELNFLRNIYF